MKIRDASGWTMFIFGILALLLGLTGLIRPEILLSLLGFDVIERAQRAAGDYTIVFMIASSMASFNIGVYYVLAALHDVKIFYRWTVPFRMVTFAVFTTVVLMGAAPGRFLGVGLWELTGAIFTGIALYVEGKSNKKKGRQCVHMRSRWIEHNGQKILIQDFANLFFNVEAVKNELSEVQEIVLNEPPNSVLIISDFTNTEISGDLMSALNQASKTTKPYVRKTAVLGVSGIKRTFGDLLSRITGQPLVYFTSEADAIEWLTKK